MLNTLFIILFLHQTTTVEYCTFNTQGCLSSCSYIKPQRFSTFTDNSNVVYHLVPTSNHNFSLGFNNLRFVVYHLVPTSNHNRLVLYQNFLFVVYHLVPTSNHNMWTETHGIALVVYHLVPTSNHNYREENNGLDEVVYHLVPTSNHNCGQSSKIFTLLFIILFLHQTTTVCMSMGLRS